MAVVLLGTPVTLLDTLSLWGLLAMLLKSEEIPGLVSLLEVALAIWAWSPTTRSSCSSSSS